MGQGVEGAGLRGKIKSLVFVNTKFEILTKYSNGDVVQTFDYEPEVEGGRLVWTVNINWLVI